MMRRFAVFSLMLALCLGGLLGYGLWGAELAVEVLEPEVIQANERVEEFNHLTELMQNQALIGTQFENAVLGTAKDYRFIVIPVRLRNRGLLDALLPEIRLSPVEGDLLCYDMVAASGGNVNRAQTVFAGSESLLRLILLTRAKEGQRRDLHISYYILGRPFYIKLNRGI